MPVRLSRTRPRRPPDNSPWSALSSAQLCALRRLNVSGLNAKARLANRPGVAASTTSTGTRVSRTPRSGDRARGGPGMRRVPGAVAPLKADDHPARSAPHTALSAPRAFLACGIKDTLGSLGAVTGGIECGLGTLHRGQGIGKRILGQAAIVA